MNVINRQKERVEDNLTALIGQRLTPHRLLLLDLLHEREHLSVNELYRQAKAKQPRINLSTVYRNLRLFSGMGLIDELRLTKSGTRYFEARSHHKHYHAICLRCGRIVDFNNPLIEEVKKAVEDETGMVIMDVRLSMAGYCAQCRGAQKILHRLLLTISMSIWKCKVDNPAG
jgi:Fur family peroxide stress response transcriptional regulator